MKRTVFLLICFTGVAYAQESLILKSDPLILKPKRDVTRPQIQILEPRATDGTSVIDTLGAIVVRGTATDESGIRRIDVNGVTTTSSPSGAFSATVSLHAKYNDILVTAEDKFGNIGTETLKVFYDVTPPVIEITEPKEDGTRGIRSLTLEVLMLRGKVFDESGVRQLLVNGVPVPVAPDSSFWKELRVREGQDSVTVAAMDNAGRRSLKKIYFTKTKPAASIDFLSGKNYALIIGIDSYSGKWPKLKNAVRDAKAVEKILSEKFIFEKIHSLYNSDATREGILGTIEYLVTNLTIEDNLLIYYSGHGVKEAPFNRGFWVPVDATERSITRYISNSEIQLMLDSQSPRHVLLIADACFAGDIFKGGGEMVPFDNNPDYYRKVSQRKSRKALTSGGEEPVLDGGRDGHSVFAYYFLQAIDHIKGAYFDAGQIYNELRIPVTNNSEQVPEFAPIKGTGDAGGQFIFVRK